MGDDNSVYWSTAGEPLPGQEAARRRVRRREGGRRSQAGSAPPQLPAQDLPPEMLAAIVRAVRVEVERRPPLPRLMTQSEVIRILRTSKSAFHRLRTGQIGGVRPFPKPRYVGKHPRWIAAEVEAWIEASTDRPV